MCYVISNKKEKIKLSCTVKIKPRDEINAFVTFFISHSKFELPRLYFNSSTACSLLLRTTLPRSWRSRRSQGTAARQGEPRAPHTRTGLLGGTGAAHTLEHS